MGRSDKGAIAELGNLIVNLQQIVLFGSDTVIIIVKEMGLRFINPIFFVQQIHLFLQIYYEVFSSTLKLMSSL